MPTYLLVAHPDFQTFRRPCDLPKQLKTHTAFSMFPKLGTNLWVNQVSFKHNCIIIVSRDHVNVSNCMYLNLISVSQAEKL